MPLPLIVFRALLIGSLGMASTALAEEAATDTAMPTVLGRIRDAGLSDDWAFRRGGGDGAGRGATGGGGGGYDGPGRSAGFGGGGRGMAQVEPAGADATE